MTKAVILCIDDEEIPRTIRALVLRKHGYEVIAVDSGKGALEKLAASQFDLVLTDQLMPGMTGTELTKEIKSTMPSMPVVIISGVNEVPADASFADRFISKIEGPQALLTGISEVLDRYRASRANADVMRSA
jgi:two-component system response regulator RegX3